MSKVESDVLEGFFGAAEEHADIPDSVVNELRKALSSDKVPNAATLRLAISSGLKTDAHVED